MMKKFCLVACWLVALSVSCLASVVPPTRAAAVASVFLSKHQSGLLTAGRPLSVDLVATFPSVPTKAPGQDPALYVYEGSNGGYVVVAGDDVSKPVIGYSLSGRFPADNLPVNLRSLLEWHASVIEYARAQGWTSDVSETESDNGRVILETARWGQGAPYNNLVPKKNSLLECPAGCVATAMAIILRYHRYPDHGTGELPGYYFDWNDFTNKYTRYMDGHALGHSYDWDQMPLRYVKGQYTDEQAAQVAQLMFDLGVMSEMDYEPEGSGAAGDAPLKLATYFGYDKQMRYLDRSIFDTEHWERMIRQDINDGLPVFYAGFSWEGGHAFVVDGYDGEYFSLNYGWEGESALFRLSPSIDGKEDQMSEFTDWQGMVCRIMPDQGGEPYASLEVAEYFIPFPWDFRSKSFTVPETWIWCFTAPEWVNVEIAYVQFDKAFNFKEQLSETVVFKGEDSVPALQCHPAASIGDGDWMMLARCNNGEWEPLPQSRQSCVHFNRRPLAELVSVGCMLGDPASPTADGYPGFYLDGPKDFYWEIWSDDLGRCLTTSASESFYEQIGGVYYSSFPAFRDETSGRTQYLFYYPSGNYRLVVRNFDEEMELTIAF